jgi:tripartite ATP-independent transporter DctM subunit
MEWWVALMIILGAMMFLLATGLQVVFVFWVVNLVGVYLLWGGTTGLEQLILSIYSSVTLFALLPIPFFVLMGEVLFHSEMAFNSINIIDQWMGKVPARLSLVGIGSATLFACLSGSSIGTTAMLGSILLPEMKKRGYKPPLSIGCCMSGGLAMIIPPSALAVILASLAEVSVGRVLIGGILPGILLALMYVAYIIGRALLQPSLAPAYTPVRTHLSERMRSTAKNLLPVGSIIFAVTGLIVLGLATPTEAAGAGALVTFIMAAFYGKLNREVIKKSSVGTLQITVMMYAILTGSLAFSQILAYSGATAGLVQFASSLPLPSILLVVTMQFVVLILGCFMEQMSILMITLPIFMPIIRSLGFSDVWFCLLMLLNMEVGMKTPPFGFLLFTMKGVAPPETTMATIYRSTLPFLIIDILGIAAIMAFPALAVWLPTLIKA